MSSAEATDTKARDLLRNAQSKITVLSLDSPLSIVAMDKMLRAIDEHGRDGVSSVMILGNWTEGASPKDFLTGFAMKFDTKVARVVSKVINARTLYAGTMAFKIPEEALVGSKLSTDGLKVHPSEILSALGSKVAVSSAGVEDSYAGIFEHKKRGEHETQNEYWAIARGVDTSANAELEKLIEAHEGKPYGDMLHASAAMRLDAFEKQRAKRAETLSNVLAAVGVKVSAAHILEHSVDNASNSLVDEGSSSATLYSDAFPINNRTRDDGIVVSENMRLGPTFLRGNSASASIPIDAKVSALPASTGLAMPMWMALKTEGFLQPDAKSTRSVTNACTWDATPSGNDFHPFLAKSAYRTRTAAWKKLESDAGFVASNSIVLFPIAVKLARPE